LSQSFELEPGLKPQHKQEVLPPESENGTDMRRPGVQEEVFKQSGTAMVEAKQHIQLKKTHSPVSLHILSVPLYVDIV